MVEDGVQPKKTSEGSFPPSALSEYLRCERVPMLSFPFSRTYPNVIGKSLFISFNSFSSSLPIEGNCGTVLSSLLNWVKGKGGN